MTPDDIHKAGDSGPSDPGKGASVQKRISRRKSAAIINKETVQTTAESIKRQKDALNHRESIADSREETVHVREKTATFREHVIHRADEGQTPPEHALTLREEAADIREETLHHREETATLRERERRELDTGEAISGDHLTMMRQANAQLVVSVIEAQKLAEQVEIAKTSLQHLAHHDVLTSLPNRMLLHDRLIQAIELARRQGRRFAVLFMDLDRFKHINDSLGHAIGDHLLQSVAQRLSSCVRHSDTLSRLGGDEFVVLLSNIAHPEDAALIAKNMLAELAAPHLIDHHELHISASIGIGIYPDHGEDAETLLQSADSAMYHSKKSGRSNYKFFEHPMNTRAVRRQSIEASLRRALEREEFVLYYQPKIDLHTQRITGAEALIRWQHPEWGLVPPLQFVPIAEDCGLILPIGRWVLGEACRQAQAWRSAGLAQVTVAVNTSVLEFSAPDFLENIRRTLQEESLEAHCLELELTESVLMRDVEFTGGLLRALADLGIMLAIDDFGTGYSSLSYLRQFPIHTLKIDKSFISQITPNRGDAALVSAIISMGKSLNLRVVAEGVETREQSQFLRDQHCDEGQGFYYGNPMTAETFATLLQTGISPHFVACGKPADE
ncbi:putative bifunctional diguanylate cyclase/phosphodiesterase [Nitrosospira sp. Is2]|uniref:putative bifunctional diguanylate cyclase/phosphodiesterase n=1 Tax=Nitrosospira sp. Is2 TaxID=3080532 RepID=UPI002952C954|nr:EAL domain-containing protein [Nitrosospira sp. Is2]WON75143.1 EAL domain-containing protein [Nitrosospira sp. Is2]